MWALYVALPPALVALAVWLDRRSRRGYGLGLLAALMLIFDIYVIIIDAQVTQQIRASHTDNLDIGLVVAVYSLIGLYCALVLLLGGITETIIARQWRWLAIILLMSLVPAVIILVPAMALAPDVLGALGLSRDVEFAALLVLPVLITLTYASTRIFQPARA